MAVNTRRSRSRSASPIRRSTFNPETEDALKPFFFASVYLLWRQQSATLEAQYPLDVGREAIYHLAHVTPGVQQHILK